MDINALKAKSLKLAEIRKAHNKKYQASKDTTEMECGCGAKFKAYNKYQHNISKKHIEWLESQQPVAPIEPPVELSVESELKRAEDKITELALALKSRDERLHHYDREFERMKNYNNDIDRRNDELGERIKFYSEKTYELYDLIDTKNCVTSMTIKQLVEFSKIVTEMYEEVEQYGLI